MDKTSLNYANLFGYQKALGLKGDQFNYLSASTWLLVMATGHRKIADFCQKWCTLVTSSDNILAVG